MRITQVQLRQIIREEVRKAVQLYERQTPDINLDDIESAAVKMTPEEARENLKDAGLDPDALLQRLEPKVIKLADEMSEKLNEEEEKNWGPAVALGMPALAGLANAAYNLSHGIALGDSLKIVAASLVALGIGAAMTYMSDKVNLD